MNKLYKCAILSTNAQETISMFEHPEDENFTITIKTEYKGFVFFVLFATFMSWQTRVSKVAKSCNVPLARGTFLLPGPTF